VKHQTQSEECRRSLFAAVSAVSKEEQPLAALRILDLQAFLEKDEVLTEE
jgi:predicted acetyltransferase